MTTSIRSFGLPSATLILTGILGYFGGTELLGAHPWWAQQVTLVGIAIGIGLFALSVFAPVDAKVFLIATPLLIAAATASSVIGKSVFVASYASNGLAGRMWYFGWFAIWAALAFGILSFVRWRHMKQEQN